MSREKPKEIYKAKVTRFGNGAKLKAFKDHVGQEVIIMKKDVYKEFLDKVKKVSKKKWTERDSERLDKAMDEVEDNMEVL